MAEIRRLVLLVSGHHAGVASMLGTGYGLVLSGYLRSPICNLLLQG